MPEPVGGAGGVEDAAPELVPREAGPLFPAPLEDGVLEAEPPEETVPSGFPTMTLRVVETSVPSGPTAE